MRRRWWEVVAVAAPLVAGAVWLGVLVAGGDDDGEQPDPIAVEAQGPRFGSLEELVAASDVVVLGEVTGIAEGRAITDPDDPTAGIRTRLVTIEVSRLLRGDAPPVLVVEEEAALLDGTPIVVNGVEPSATGDRGVYFLVAGADPAAPYHAVVNEQGRYLLGDVDSSGGLQPSSTDALSVQLAGLGLDGLVAAVLAI